MDTIKIKLNVFYVRCTFHQNNCLFAFKIILLFFKFVYKYIKVKKKKCYEAFIENSYSNKISTFVRWIKYLSYELKIFSQSRIFDWNMFLPASVTILRRRERESFISLFRKFLELRSNCLRQLIRSGLVNLRCVVIHVLLQHIFYKILFEFSM